jgi:hypothetical protein
MPGEAPNITAIDAIAFEFTLQHIGYRIRADPGDETRYTAEASDRHGRSRGGATTLREKTRGAVLLCALRQLRGAKDIVLHRMTDAEHELHEEVTS